MNDSDFEDRIETLLTDVSIEPGNNARAADADHLEKQFDELFSDLDVSVETGEIQEEPSALTLPQKTTKRTPKRSTLTLAGLFRRKRLTLSLEATELRLLVVRGQRIVHWDRLPLPGDVVRNGQIVQPTAFGQAVVRQIEQAKAPRRKAVVGLFGQRALIRTLSLPSVPARMLDEAVHREARRELPLPLDELYLSWQVIGDRNASRLQVFTLGVPREAVDSYVIGLRSANVRPVAMDLKPLALVRAVNLPDVLIADVEAESKDVVLVRGFVPHIVRSVALPGEGQRALDERADHLAVEIQRILDFYGSTQAAHHSPWSPVICLTGALGAEAEMREQVGAHWPLVEPEPPLSLPESLPLLPYLTNIGLALKRAS